MQIKIKKLNPEVTVPVYGRDGDAGFDVFATSDVRIPAGERITIQLGFAMEIPNGYVALVWDRSGMASKKGIHSMAGVIDSTYRGEVGIVLYNTTSEHYQIQKGDKVAQILIQKHETAEFVEVDKLSETERGDHAWLSSGR